MKKIFTILTCAAAVVAIVSCEKYEDGRPPKGAKQHFEDNYPSARDVEWELERELDGNYWEVSFEIGTGVNAVDYSAKYDVMGNWVETKKDVFLSDVPAAVQSAFDAKYAGAQIDDVDYVETPGGNFYEYDIILNGTATEIRVASDGAKASMTPSKAAERGFANKTPETDVWDVEWDFEGTHWEVSYETGTRPYGTEYTMYFDLEGNWVATKTEILINSVPQDIMTALAASEYGTYPMDDREADYLETAEGKMFYRFEVEIGERDAEIDVALDGTVTFRWDY